MDAYYYGDEGNGRGVYGDGAFGDGNGDGRGVYGEGSFGDGTGDGNGDGDNSFRYANHYLL